MKSLRTICYEVKAYLNTALCQSPPNISKTQKAMEYIKHFALLSRFLNNSDEQGVHHITVILTNNNLSETKQWKIRLEKSLRGLNVMVLSSKKTSDIKNLDQLWGKLTRAKKADDMPDLIVMCSHDKRASDLVELLKTLKTARYDFSDIGIHHITMSIMFDEADKNIELISSCLNEMNPLLTDTSGAQKIDNVLRDIHFITATPLKAFWKKLRKCGIDKLKNVNNALRSLDRNSPLHMDYKTLMEDYRWLKEHNRVKSSNNMTQDTMEYAMHIVETVLQKTPGVKTVFAPSDIYIASHEDMRKAFQKKKYWVYVDNSESKGFFDCDGEYTNLDEFNAKYKVQGELYNTLVKWRELYPDQNIAITGYLNIVRGITFNTKGFNFTDAILSAYHMKNVADLVQLFGRANGGKEYVRVMNIHCPDDVWNCADTQIQLMSELHNKNPEEFEEKDFRPGTLKDLMEKAWTVPKKFQIEAENWNQIKKLGNGKKWNKESIFTVLNNCPGGDTIVNELRTRFDVEKDCFMVSMPETEKARKKYISDFLEKAQQGRPYNMNIHKSDKQKNGYQIFLDNIGHTILVSIYNGSLIPKEAFGEETNSCEENEENEGE